MLIAVLVSLTLPLVPHCMEVELVTLGRSAQGSAIMPESAPHLLIKALDHLPAWVEGSATIDRARIATLKAGPAVNVIPRRATAIVDISIAAPNVEDEDVVADLALTLGSKVEVKRLTTPCRPPE